MSRHRSEEHTSELQSPTTLFPSTTLFRSVAAYYAPVDARIKQAGVTLVSSHLTLMECLVLPLRQGQTGLKQDYDDFFATQVAEQPSWLCYAFDFCYAFGMRGRLCYVFDFCYEFNRAATHSTNLRSAGLVMLQERLDALFYGMGLA